MGIIGFGNMGSSIAQRLKTDYKICVFDTDRAKTADVSGITVTANSVALVKIVNVVILAIKPQDFDSVLAEIKADAEAKLVISIAAGITTAYIEKYLPKVRIVRVMPNLPAKIGKGMICLCKGKSATHTDVHIVQQLFANLGTVLLLNDDRELDSATAISGSGPGYLYDWACGRSIEEIKEYTRATFIPSLIAAAIERGFTHKQAKILAKVTAYGSIEYLKDSKLSPEELKKQVASKGGTTEAGLRILHSGGSLKEAVEAAFKRARQLARG